MKDDGRRPLAQQLLEADQAAHLVGQDEGRHRITRDRRRRAGAALLQPAHQPVHGLGERWAERPYRIGKRLEPLVQRSIHVATMLEGFLESFGKRPGGHPTTPNVWQRGSPRGYRGERLMQRHDLAVSIGIIVGCGQG
jgi:hypothetical protein